MIARYDVRFNIEGDDEGEYVLYSDHCVLIDDLEQQIIELEELVIELEARLEGK